MVKLLSFVKTVGIELWFDSFLQGLNDTIMFLACMVSDVKSVVIISFKFLHVMYHFFLDVLNFFFLSLKDKVNLITICFVQFLFYILFLMFGEFLGSMGLQIL